MQGLIELGQRIRCQRRKMGLTLQEVADRSGVSKPYLSLIETGQVDNPPSDAKLAGLEKTLAFSAGELVLQAHLVRTPEDVRQMIQSLLVSVGQGPEITLEALRIGQRNTSGMRQSASTSAPLAYAQLRAAESFSATGTAGPVSRQMRMHSRGGSALAVAPRAESTTIYSTAVSTTPRRAIMRSTSSRLIPLIHCQGGVYPRTGANFDPMAVATESIDCPFVADAEAFAMEIDDPAMSDQYSKGDIVVFSPGQQWISGDDCFVRFRNGQAAFRRVFLDRDAIGQPRLKLQPLSGSRPAHYLLQVDVCGCDKAIYRYHRLQQQQASIRRAE